MFAYIVLFGWPLVVVALFNRLSLQLALVSSVVAGYLLLPTQTEFNIPILPTIDKTFIPSFSALLMSIIVLRRRAAYVRVRNDTGDNTKVLPGLLPRSWLGRLLLFTMFAGIILTTVTNQDALQFLTNFRPAMSHQDTFAVTMNSLVALMPFFLARKFLSDSNGHKTILIVLSIAGLLYSLPTLWEIRMSPQLNRTVYGFFPHSWIQHVRGDGFRPLVFLRHGLWLGIFLSSATLATFMVFRFLDGTKRWLFFGAAIWLLLTLSISKNVGAFGITLLLAPMILMFGVRLQLLVAASITVIFISYPILRGADLVPVDQVLIQAEKISPERAQSLGTRLDNEESLLEKANERPFFGWGGWSRARVYDERGTDLSTTDGRWIISIGEGGWIGYLSEFGLLSMSIIILALRRKKYEITLVTSGLCLVLAGNVMDLIPNSGLTPVTWLMAGALIGRLETPAGRVLASSKVPQRRVFTRQQISETKTDPADGALPVPDPVQRKYSRQPKTSRPLNEANE